MKRQNYFIAVALITAPFFQSFECSAQASTFQSFTKFNVAVECPCELQASKRINSMSKFTGETVPITGYECSGFVDGEEVRYSFTIKDYRKKYSVMPLVTYNKSVEKELERLTLNFAKSGSMVRWARLQGVYGVQTTSQFESISTLAIFLIKDGVEYEMEVQGKGNYYNEYISFIDSFKTL